MAHYLSRFDRAIITAGRVFAFLFFVGIVLVPRAKHRLFLAFGLSRSPRYFARTRHLRRVPQAVACGFFSKRTAIRSQPTMSARRSEPRVWARTGDACAHKVAIYFRLCKHAVLCFLAFEVVVNIRRILG